MDYRNDGDRRVLFVEVTDGFDPEVDDPGSTKGDPHGGVANFADYDLDGDRYKWMRMTLKNESAAPYFEIHFASPTSGYAVATSANFGIEPNSDYTTYIWNIEEWYERYYPKRDADHPQGGTSDPFFNHWSGHINNLRLDFMYYNEPGGQARTGDKIYIQYIAFFETEEAANAWTYTPARTPASIEEARAAAQAERDAAQAEAEAAQTEAANAEAEEPAQDSEPDAENQPANAPDTNNTGGSSDSEEGGFPVVIVIIIIVAVVAIIAIVVVMGKKKKSA
jgi:hypothetical protein